MKTALLVTQDGGRASAIAQEFEARLYDVMWCPGPRAPTFACVSARGGRCPLTAYADVVIVDGWLAAEENRSGTPYWRLVLYYHSLGIPVVVLVGAEALPGPVPDETIVALRRDAPATEIADVAVGLVLRDAIGRVAERLATSTEGSALRPRSAPVC
jgi:hypothetical protein